MPGAKGEKGPMGTAGLPGDIGPDGHAGLKGPQGKKGPRGERVSYKYMIPESLTTANSENFITHDHSC